MPPPPLLGVKRIKMSVKMVIFQMSQCALQTYKFHQNIFNGYQVIERTRFCNGQTDYGQTQGEKQYVSQP